MEDTDKDMKAFPVVIMIPCGRYLRDARNAVRGKGTGIEEREGEAEGEKREGGKRGEVEERKN